MRTLNFGESLPSTSGLYVSVKKKGDSITFRIAAAPVYVGRHFIKMESGKWNILDCPRINNPEGGEECELCQRYFEIMSEAKEAKEAGDDEAFKALKEEARDYGSSIQFYFPILNRDTKQFQILRTTLGIRNKLDEQFQSGVNVMASDWILRNTGSDSPRDLYSLIRKDSSEVEEFDEKEKAEFEKAKSFDMSTISENVSKRSLEPEEDDDIVETAKEIFEK